MPEVAPGGNGTRFCGEYRVAAAVRGAALPVRRAAGPWAHARPRMVAMEGKLAEFWQPGASQVAVRARTRCRSLRLGTYPLSGCA